MIVSDPVGRKSECKSACGEGTAKKGGQCFMRRAPHNLVEGSVGAVEERPPCEATVLHQHDRHAAHLRARESSGRGGGGGSREQKRLGLREKCACACLWLFLLSDPTCSTSIASILANIFTKRPSAPKKPLPPLPLAPLRFLLPLPPAGPAGASPAPAPAAALPPLLRAAPMSSRNSASPSSVNDVSSPATGHRPTRQRKMSARP
jgi:hypothetical protein